MSREKSSLDKFRKDYQPKLAGVLAEGINNLDVQLGEFTEAEYEGEIVKGIFPHIYGSPIVKFVKGKGQEQNRVLNVGVVLSGGQAPGGHNVIAGLFDGLKAANPENKLYGFLGGPSGIVDCQYKEITQELVNEYRNTGGFDMIASGRTKIEKDEQFTKCMDNLKNLNINALVVVGGDDSNTNAALLAEYFKRNNSDLQVIGVPKTIDGDLKNQWVEASFGFDTCSKVYSELIGNLLRDANSAKKYWHFIRLMGRSASHIALECALQTHPNVTLISEEVAEKKMSLREVVDILVNAIVKRHQMGKDFGIALIPEGIIEFIPEMKRTINSLNELLAKYENVFNELDNLTEKIQFIMQELNEEDERVFASLPLNIQDQLLEDRDPHGNVQVSKIETEKLLILMVKKRLEHMKHIGEFKGKFNPVAHFFGYEGRCCQPSNFDSDYCYSLGYNACALILSNLTGYMSAISNTVKSANEWQPGGIPLTMMMTIERRHGNDKPVIRKALVELHGRPFKVLEQNRQQWLDNEDYMYPGPIQYWGPAEVADATTKTLELEHSAVKV